MDKPAFAVRESCLDRFGQSGGGLKYRGDVGDGCAGVRPGIRDSTRRSFVFLKAGLATCCPSAARYRIVENFGETARGWLRDFLTAELEILQKTIGRLDQHDRVGVEGFLKVANASCFGILNAGR
jgi:hypothetical protein